MLVVHVARGDDLGAPARAGFVVSRAVGPAVVRNQVKRRLRHLMRERLASVPAGWSVVVRALPSAAAASRDHLAAALDQSLRRGCATLQRDGRRVAHAPSLGQQPRTQAEAMP